MNTAAASCGDTNRPGQAVAGEGGDRPYMYDELRYGGVPSKENAQQILADLEAGKVWLHPVSEPGCKVRLEDLAAGRSVDPQFWQRASIKELP